jgi:hypothetical protein
LEKFGIAAHKEAEIYECGPGNVAAGARDYVGWYHFIGAILKDPGTAVKIFAFKPEAADWLVSFDTGTNLALEPLQGLSLVRMEFGTDLPWVLDESI